jgi:multidrug resistance protein
VLLVVFTTILIDFVGYTVLIPVLPLYAERLGASDLQVALILAVYALAQLLFLPAWGWVSDRIGRRPVILVSLFGTVCSFVVLAFAESIAMIYVARVLAGFFAASIGAAQAVVTDVTPPAERAGGMGVIGAAFGAGMVVGPVIGGFTAELSDAAPFYTVAILAAANFVAAWIWLPESRDPALAGPDWSDFGRALVPTPLRLLLVVHDRAIGLFLYLFFHIFSAFAVLEALTTLYVGKAFGKEPLDVGLLFMGIGAVLVVTQGMLLRRLVSTFGESRLVGMGLVAMGGGLMLLPLLPAFGWFYPVCGLIAFGTGITFPAFTSLYSKVCMAENAGELLGLSQAMGTTGRIVGPFVGGLLMQGVTLGAPFVFAGAMMLVALAMFGVFRRTLTRGAV